jgi:hypothetical protein
MEVLGPVQPLAPLVVPRDFQDAVHAWRTERPEWARLEEHVQRYIQIYEDEGHLWADDPSFQVSANPVPAAWGEPSLDAPWSPPPPPPPPPSPPPEWQDAASGKIIPVGTQALRGAEAGASRAYRAIVAWESVTTASQRTHTVGFAAERRGDEQHTVHSHPE